VRCDECGFEYEDVTAAEVPERLRQGARALAGLLTGEVRRRPAEGVWSPLEYGCHVRDMIDTQRYRIELALREDCPTFAPMGRDELVVTSRYNEQDPDVVRVELVRTADALADYLEALSPEEQHRTGIYQYPAPAERTIVWIGVNTVHELVHHAMDVARPI